MCATRPRRRQLFAPPLAWPWPTAMQARQRRRGCKLGLAGGAAADTWTRAQSSGGPRCGVRRCEHVWNCEAECARLAGFASPRPPLVSPSLAGVVISATANVFSSNLVPEAGRASAPSSNRHLAPPDLKGQVISEDRYGMISRVSAPARAHAGLLRALQEGLGVSRACDFGVLPCHARRGGGHSSSTAELGPFYGLRGFAWVRRPRAGFLRGVGIVSGETL